MNKNTFFASILQGGGLGIYTDFLFGKIQQSTSSLATLAGPGITEATKVVAIFNYLFKGEFSEAFDSVKEAGKETIDVMTGVDGTVDKITETVTNANKAINNLIFFIYIYL